MFFCEGGCHRRPPPSSAFDCPMREVGEAGGGRAPTFPLDLRGVLGHPSCRDITSRRSNASPLLQPAAVTPPSSAGSPPSEPENDKYAKRPVSRLAKRLDIFPKTERDYTVRTERGGAAHRDRVRDNGDDDARGVDDVRRAFDRDRLEHIVVDTRYVCSFAIYFRRKRK